MFQTEFFSYLQLGFAHIADIAGYDHILFVTALAAMYHWQDRKRLLWLITAFTVGHSITLALSVVRIISFSSSFVEFCIPVTIFLTSCFNIAELKQSPERKYSSTLSAGLAYLVTLCFGFIHGMGFSTFLKSLLGQETNILLPLLAFNLGLECGQIVIVVIVLSLTSIMVRFAGFQRRDWALILSSIALGIALTLMLKNNPF